MPRLHAISLPQTPATQCPKQKEQFSAHVLGLMVPLFLHGLQPSLTLPFLELNIESALLWIYLFICLFTYLCMYVFVCLPIYVCVCLLFHSPLLPPTSPSPGVFNDLHLSSTCTYTSPPQSMICYRLSLGCKPKIPAWMHVNICTNTHRTYTYTLHTAYTHKQRTYIHSLVWFTYWIYANLVLCTQEDWEGKEWLLFKHCCYSPLIHYGITAPAPSAAEGLSEWAQLAELNQELKFSKTFSFCLVS